MVLWNISMKLRLKQLAEEGLEGADIASRLSAEFGEVFTVNAVFHKSSRLGLALRGRSPKSYDMGSTNPFDEPVWLQKELAKLQPEKRERPKVVKCLGFDMQTDVTDEMVAEAEKEGLREAWVEYVETVLRNQRCKPLEAEEAKQRAPPAWFRRWAQIYVVVGYDLGNVPPLPKKVERAVKVVSELQAQKKARRSSKNTLKS